MGLHDGSPSRHSRIRGGSASTELTGYLSDFDENGDPVPPSEISLSLVSNSNEGLIQVSLDGQTVKSTVDQDSHGVAEVVIMADDGSKTSQTSVVFYVINVNDAPEMDVSTLDGLALKSGELASIGIPPLSLISTIRMMRPGSMLTRRSRSGPIRLRQRSPKHAVGPARNPLRQDDPHR